MVDVEFSRPLVVAHGSIKWRTREAAQLTRMVDLGAVTGVCVRVCRHHATPQKIGHDVDLDTLPLVMFNPEVKNTKKGKAMYNKSWIGLQSYLFAPVTCLLVGLFWQLYLHPRHAIRSKRWDEVASLAARWVALYTLWAATGASAAAGVAAYLFHSQIGTMYIFLVSMCFLWKAVGLKDGYRCMRFVLCI